MASPTLTEQLDAVNNAILALVSGARSYTIAGRSVTKEDLTQLREWRRELQQEVGLQTQGPAKTLLTFDNPS